MNSDSRTLSEAELDLISGGMRDNPFADAQNQRNAKENGAEGTFGGNLGHQLVGDGPGGAQGGKPFDWP